MLSNRTIGIKILLIALFFTPLISRAGDRSIERTISAMGVKVRLSIKPLDENKALIHIWNAKGGAYDTVQGRGIIPLWIAGKKSQVFFGKFGQSQLPMLIVGLSNPDRIQDSRVLAYEVTKQGALIGQRVFIDESLDRYHTDNTSGGRYDLVMLDPKQGSIHSISYQDAHFTDYTLSFEKLRIRQWEPSFGGFIETDAGFLRDPKGKLIESVRFHQLSDRAREQLFLSNVIPNYSAPNWKERSHHPKVVTAVRASLHE